MLGELLPFATEILAFVAACLALAAYKKTLAPKTGAAQRRIERHKPTEDDIRRGASYV